MPQPLVSVIIVNWNGRRWLEKCLDSLMHQSYRQLEVVVVDNASTDDSCDFVRQHYPRVKLVASRTNGGFATGTNQGVSAAQGEYLLLLNPDTWVEPHFMQQLMQAYDAENYDVLAPIQAQYDGRSHLAYVSTLDPLGHPVFLEGAAARRATNFYLNGSAVLCKTELYRQTGGLDSSFFLFCEEVDWFWRLRLLGKSFAYTEAATVYHAIGGLRGAGLSYHNFLWRNQGTLHMLLKNFAWYNLAWVLPLYLVENTLEALAFLALMKPKLSLSYLQGWAFNLRHWPAIMQQRRYIQRHRVMTDRAILRAMYRGSSRLRQVGRRFMKT